MPDEKPFHNPFGALSHLRDSLPQPAQTDPPRSEPTSDSTSAAPGRGPARAVVRMERSGRGGKEVTAIEQLSLSATDRENWLKALKTAMGCGGTLEGDTLVLQGDQRKRVPAWLTARGVRKVIVS